MDAQFTEDGSSTREGSKKFITQIPIGQKPICIYYMTMMYASIKFIQQSSINLLSKNDLQILLLMYRRSIEIHFGTS